MSQEPKVLNMMAIKRQKKNDLTDHEKVVFAYHAFDQGNDEQAISLLKSVSQSYYLTQLHKDISRALLCQATYKNTLDPVMGKQSEFYLVIFYLVKIITSRKLMFQTSGYFYQLKDELFKDFGV